VTNSSSFNPADKVHLRTPSGGIQLDRPGAPPPNPPSTVDLSSSKQTQSLPITNYNSDQNLPSPTEDKNDSPPLVTTPTSENVNVGKLISELNNRMAVARANNNNTQTNNTQTNNIRASYIKNPNINSPGETTDF
jgi:hypothetical protein